MRAKQLLKNVISKFFKVEKKEENPNSQNTKYSIEEYEADLIKIKLNVLIQLTKNAVKDAFASGEFDQEICEAQKRLKNKGRAKKTNDKESDQK